MAHHNIKDHELRFTCVYCGKNLKEKFGWKSEHDSQFHYKTIKCECGKEVWMHAQFEGSGHDTWDGSKDWVKKITANVDDHLTEHLKLIVKDCKEKRKKNSMKILKHEKIELPHE